jgi:phospholipid/cholesterol/gamma-HCH transport system substrate-binding protein
MKLKVVRLTGFVLVTGLMALYMGAQLANFSFTDRYNLTATFRDASGLNTGDPVRIAGVPVGQVTSIHLDGDLAKVRFKIDKSVKLPRGATTVEIRWRNLIGQRYLNLKFDPAAAAKATSFVSTNGSALFSATAKNPDGSHETTSTVDIGSVFNALQPLATAIDPAQLNTIFQTLTQAFDGNDANITNITRNLRTISATLASRDSTIQQMLTDYNSLGSVLSRRDGQIQTMIDNLVLLSQAFSDNTNVFEQALSNFSTAGSSLNQVLGANEQQLKSLLDNSAQLANTLTGKLPQIEASLKGLPATFASLFSAVNGGDFIRIDSSCFQFTHMPCTTPYAVP